MHLIESYSRILGAKINKPSVYAKFFSLPFDKYITVQSSSPMPAKNYPYLQDAIDSIKPELDKRDIHIVQLGSKEDFALRGVYSLLGATSINQSAYVISNSLVHFGIDSSMIHLASAYNVPTIGIYSISPPCVCGNYFSKSEFLEPRWNNRSYAFNPGEAPPPAKTIKPEEVVEKIGNIINIEFPKISSLYFGPRYQDSVIEYIPTHAIDPNWERGRVINVRLDFALELDKYNDQAMLHTLQNREVVIITDKPINTRLLIPFKDKIKTVMCWADSSNIDEKFIVLLKNSGIRFSLVCKDEAKLKDLKFKYMDYETVRMVKKAPKEDYELVKKLDLSRSFYKSNRFILCEGNFYISKAALYENKPLNSLDFFGQQSNIIQNQDMLLEELEYLYFYV